jgi:hypothetical protein
MKYFKHKLISAVCLSTFALTGCHEDSTSNPTTPTQPMTNVSGTAAIGSPIANAQIDLKCNGFSKDAAATTNAEGQWSASVPTAQLPCATRLTGGNVGTAANTQKLYSVTTDIGASTIVNITPLSDLILAKIVNSSTGEALDSWYTSASFVATLNTLFAQVSANVSIVLSQLSAQGYTLPSGTFNPFSIPFTTTLSDPYDQLLEQIGRAIAASSSHTYDQFKTNYLTGTSIPLVPSTTPPATTPPATTPPASGATCASLSKPKAAAGDLTQFVGTYQVKIGNATTAIPLTIAANGDIGLNSKTATASDICGPFVQSNGQGLLILAKNTTNIQVNVFKDTSGKITTEGPDFTSTTGDFFFGVLGGTTPTPAPAPAPTPVTPLTQVFSLNPAACTVASADSLMTVYWQCHENVVQDMNLSLKTPTGAPCNLQKIGNLVKVTVGGNTISDSYNADQNDSLGIPNPTGQFATFETSLIVKTVGVVEIDLSFNPNGIFKSVIATQTSPLAQMLCLP